MKLSIKKKQLKQLTKSQASSVNGAGTNEIVKELLTYSVMCNQDSMACGMDDKTTKHFM
ncbi:MULTISPECIES: hypothetical protein [Pseudoalteromonas]|uniref:hypothetical protein n=1 Tax=Pseudoalteromonas TaxID=53246 RepID=UPI0002D95623|nr:MULTISPECIES: hypothetical protein [Pseudoalteromonas]AUJ71773.1 hypothetical protein PNC201_17780 [Pseudoalteromonas sp. NC201]MBR8845667.1 hypothetical protein [Pseudoalteromonas sp. JC3]MCF2828703.1 hypothetical protein [Pseudoalteromonas sp. OF5H-5]MCF2833442.1 hypothetical protein [Pseudoalteromonas sp. DL2-H6]MCF2925125.1 hypothetical protein [Pseudoalteromonas sp. DL2-H1]